MFILFVIGIVKAVALVVEVRADASEMERVFMEEEEEDDEEEDEE